MPSALGRIAVSGRIPVSGRIAVSGRISAASERGGMMEFIGNGLTAYYRNDIETITSSGGLVSSWADISGNGFHATQSTTSRKPTLTSNWTGNFPGITFGTSKVLAIAARLATNRFPLTMGGVFQSTSNSAGRTIFAPSSTGGGTYLSIHAGSTASREIDSNQVGAVSDGLATTNVEVWIATVESNPNPVLGQVKLYTSTSNTQQTLNTPILTVNATTGSVAFIGGLTSSGTQAFAGGTIGELFIMNRLMTTAERVQYLTYVQTRYGVI